MFEEIKDLLCCLLSKSAPSYEDTKKAPTTFDKVLWDMQRRYECAFLSFRGKKAINRQKKNLFKVK